MLQARLAGAATVAGLSLFTLHVRRERNLQPTGRLLQFVPGSDDERIGDRLQTGDIILFARDPTLYAPLGAAVCAARKSLSGTPFDQAAVVVRRRGTPYILERTFSGVKLRRFDHRLQCCRSEAVLLRPLGLGRLTTGQADALDATLARLLPAAEDASSRPAAGVVDDGYDVNGNRIPVVTPRSLTAGVPGALRELAWLPLAPATNASVELVEEVYGALGLRRGSSGVVAAAAAPLTMADLLPPAQPWAPAAHYTAPVRVRDRL